MNNDRSLVIPVEQTTTEEKEISEQLASRLAKVSALEEGLKVMTEKYNEEIEKRRRITSERDALKQLDIKKQELSDWEERLKIKESLLEKSEELILQKEKHSEQRVEDHKEMVNLIFRNPVIMKRGTVPVVVGGSDSSVIQPDGSYALQSMGTFSTEEEVTSEEEIG